MTCCLLPGLRLHHVIQRLLLSHNGGEWFSGIVTSQEDVTWSANVMNIIHNAQESHHASIAKYIQLWELLGSQHWITYTTEGQLLCILTKRTEGVLLQISSTTPAFGFFKQKQKSITLQQMHSIPRPPSFLIKISKRRASASPSVWPEKRYDLLQCRTPTLIHC